MVVELTSGGKGAGGLESMSTEGSLCFCPEDVVNLLLLSTDISRVPEGLLACGSL